MPDVKIAPSILASDFSRLASEISQVQDVAESIHVDVMDGHFVPNITIGPVVSNSLSKAERVTAPLSIHLMISDPWKYGPKFSTGPGDKIIFHTETTNRPKELIERLGESGCGVGVSQKPASDPEEVIPLLPLIDEVLVMGVEPGFGGQEYQPETTDRIRFLSEKIAEINPEVKVAVDGGMNTETIAEAAGAGADVIIAGSAVFGADHRRRAIDKLVKAGRGG